MKKIIKSLLTVLIIISLFTSVGCNPGATRRKYTGVVCEEEYLTLENALDAYVLDELSSPNGESYSVEDYEKTSDLTIGEMSAVGIDSKTAKGERGILTYSLDGDEILYKTEIYLIKEDGGYRYCSVIPADDTPLNKSYFDFIVAEDQYENVTVTLTSTAIVNHEGYKTNTKTTVTLLNTKDYGYISFESQVFSNGKSESEYMQFWIVKDENGQKIYSVNNDGDFIEVTERILPVLNSPVEEISPLGILSEYDHTIFMYSEEGFYLKESAKEELKLRFLEEVFETTDGEVYAINTDVKLEGKRILTVEETANAKSGNVKISTQTEIVYTNFGKTTIKIPDEIKDKE